MSIPNLTSRTSCGVFYWTFQNYMSKRAEKARLARANVIKLCWPLSFALTLLFCAVLLVLFTNSAKPYGGKQTVRSSRQCAKEDSFCQVQPLSASLRSFFSNVGCCRQIPQRKEERTTPQVCGDSCTAYHWATHISCHLHGCGVSCWISADLRRR